MYILENAQYRGTLHINLKSTAVISTQFQLNKLAFNVMNKVLVALILLFLDNWR